MLVLLLLFLDTWPARRLWFDSLVRAVCSTHLSLCHYPSPQQPTSAKVMCIQLLSHYQPQQQVTELPCSFPPNPLGVTPGPRHTWHQLSRSNRRDGGPAASRP